MSWLEYTSISISWGPSCSWSYSSLIYKYMCNHCLSKLKLWVRITFRARCNKILCDKVCQWFTTGRLFSTGTLVSSTNTTDCHDINEILLKVALNTINPNPSISCNLRQWFLCNISACLLVGSGQMLHIFRQRIYISNNHYYWAYYRGNAHSFVLKDNLGFQIYTKRIYLVRFKHEMEIEPD